MSEIPSDESRKYELTPGEKNTLSMNRPVRFEIKTVGGTIISGIITPNNPLEVTPGDDIASYNIYIQDELLNSPSTNET